MFFLPVTIHFLPVTQNIPGEWLMSRSGIGVRHRGHVRCATHVGSRMYCSLESATVAWRLASRFVSMPAGLRATLRPPQPALALRATRATTQRAPAAVLADEEPNKSSADRRPSRAANSARGGDRRVKSGGTGIVEEPSEHAAGAARALRQRPRPREPSYEGRGKRHIHLRPCCPLVCLSHSSS